MREESFATTLSRYLLLAAIVFASLGFGCMEPLPRAILQLLLFCALAAWAIGGAYRPCPAHRTTFLVLCGLLILGALQASNPWPAFAPAPIRPFTASRAATAAFLLQAAAYAAALWCLPQLLDSRKRLRRMLWAVVATGVAVTFLGAIQAGTGNKLIYGLREVGNWRPFGPVLHRNHAASVLLMAFFCAAGLFFAHRARLAREKERERRSGLWSRQFLSLACGGILLVGLMLCRSRAASAVLVAVSLAAGLWAAGRSPVAARRWAARAGIAALGVFLAWGAFRGYRYLNDGMWYSIQTGRFEDSAKVRLSLYHSALALARDFPWTGVGLGSVAAALPGYLDRTLIGELHVAHPISDWLEFLAEGGLVGACLAAFGFVAVLLRLRGCASREVSAMAGGMACGLSAMLLHASVDYPFRTPASAMVFMAVLAGLGSSVVEANRQESVQEPRVPAATAKASRWAAGLAALALGALSVRAATGAAKTVDGRTTAEEWEQAWFLDPQPSYAYRAGLAWLRRADAEPGLRKEHARRALTGARRALSEQPAHPAYRQLLRSCLLALGRTEDAQSAPLLSGRLE